MNRPAATRRTLDGSRADGFRHVRVELGHAVEEDIAMLRAIADGFAPGEIRVGDADGARRRDECRSVRGRAAHPMKLDESLNSPADFRRALADDAMDAAALKVSTFGGLAQSRVIRDRCVDAGIPLTIEDSCSGVAAAAYAHLAVGTPPAFLVNTTDQHHCNTTQLARGAPAVANGRMTVADRPGLGVEPDFDGLGAPVMVLGDTA